MVVIAGLGLGKIVAIIVVIIMAGGVGVLYLNSQHAISRTLPSFQNTNGTVPQAFRSISTSSESRATLTLATLTQTHLSNASQFGISYTGSIAAAGEGLTSLLSLDSPLYANYSSYGSELRFSLNATGVPVLGAAQLAFFNLSGGEYVCTNLNATALTSGNLPGAVLGNKATSCAKGNSLAGVNLAQVAAFNFSQLNSEGVQMGSYTVYQSVYDGTPCTYLTVPLSMQYANGTQYEQGSLGICYSDTYYVPLSLGAYLSGSKFSFSLVLNESSISSIVPRGYVESLPGPVN